MSTPTPLTEPYGDAKPRRYRETLNQPERSRYRQARLRHLPKMQKAWEIAQANRDAWTRVSDSIGQVWAMLEDEPYGRRRELIDLLKSALRELEFVRLENQAVTQ